MFPCIRTRKPSVVTAGSCAACSASLARARSFSRSARMSVIVPAGGFTHRSPRDPSTATMSPGEICSDTRPAPTTAGVLRARATMAVWLVDPPTSVTKAATRPVRASIAASAGERSWAMMIAPCGTSSSTSTTCPSRFRTTRSAMKSTSARRSRKYSSGISSKRCLIFRVTRRTAHSALICSAAMSLFTSSTSIGSRSISRCASRISAWSLPSLCSSRAFSSTS